MYKLVIVDDEQEVRQGIINKIDWAEFGFEVIGQAENGREALDIIEDNIPDVIITDISMPLMDGLELTAEIKESYPTIKVIILTGFDEFKFAQQAIKHGVSDYILKPILPKDIRALMAKLKDTLDQEIAEKEDKDKLLRHYNESLPVLRESFLTSLILVKVNPLEIEKKIELFGLNIKGSFFATAVIGFDIESQNKNKTWDINLLKFSILNITQEILDRHLVGEAFFFDNTPIVVMGIQNVQRHQACNQFIKIINEIRQSVQRFLKMTVTVGLGSIFGSLTNMTESYKSARVALDYKLVLGGNKVIFVEDIEQFVTDIIVFDEAKERMLISGIKFGTKDDVRCAIEALFNDVNTSKVSITEYQLYFMEIFTSLSKLARAFDIDINEMLSEEKVKHFDVSSFNTTEEIKDWLKSLCSKLTVEIAKKRKGTKQLIFDKAKDYIMKNFGDYELSVQKLADHLHISASYLSLIFKKEAGTTFLKYLIKVRLDTAVALLKNPDNRISYVAEKVGYPDVSYFSYFFKKNFGLSPREFRNKDEKIQ